MEEEYYTVFQHVSHYQGQPRTTTELRTEAVTLDEMFAAFEDFLRGCGFTFDGHITLEETEE